MKTGLRGANQATRAMIIAVVAAVGCASSPAQRDETQQGRQSLAVSHIPPRARQSISDEPLVRSLPLDVVVALRDHESSALGATPDEYARVVAWAGAHGLAVRATSPARTTISLRGDAATLERAFGTQLGVFHDGRGTFFAPKTELAVDADVAPLVAAVVGLDDAVVLDPPIGIERTNGGLDPIDVTSLYGFNSTLLRGAGETIAILGAGFPPDPVADVDGFIKKFKLSTVRAAQYTQVFLGGPTRDNANLANNWYGENLLDIDVVMGSAPEATYVHVFAATLTPGVLADGLLYIVNQVPQAHSAMVSLATCERAAAAYYVVIDTILRQAKAQGQQWYFPTGDRGSNACNDSPASLSLAWPASSPYAIAVGGTELSGVLETAWAASGGGESATFTKPNFQSGIGPYPLDGARQVPDVAALAGNPGISTYAQGQVFPSQGTSAAAGMWAACGALIDQSQGGNGLRNVAERLYSLGQAQSSGGAAVFNDVTSGSNGAFTAGPGYDLVTGWGSPKLATMVANW